MIDDYKEIAFPRHKRAGIFKDFQWLWQHDQDPYKATTDKISTWSRVGGYEVPSQAHELLEFDSILFKDVKPGRLTTLQGRSLGNTNLT